MASEYNGNGTWLGVGLETSWASVHARQTWSEVISEDLQEKPSRVPRPHLVGSSALMPRSKVLTKVETAGSVELLVRYTGIGILLKAMLGKVTDSGAGPTYSHLFELATPLPSLSLEVIRGDSGLSEIFIGCVIPRWTLSFAAFDFAKLKLEVLGKSASAARGAAGTPTAGDGSDVLGHQAGTLSWNSLTKTIHSLEISGDNKLQSRDRLGSLYTAEPVPTGVRAVTIKVTVDADDAFYAAYLAGTESDLAITFTGQTPNVMAIAGNACWLKSCTDPISQQGMVTQQLEFEVLADASGGGLSTGFTITITNADATYDIN